MSDLQPKPGSGDPQIVVVPTGASVGAPLAAHSLSSVAVDAPVVIVAPGASAGLQPSRPADVAASMNANNAGEGSIFAAIRANRKG